MKKTTKKQMTMTQITNTLKKEGFYKSEVSVIMPTVDNGCVHIKYIYFATNEWDEGFAIKTNSKIDYFIVSTEYEHGEFAKSFALHTLQDVLIYSRRVRKAIEIKRENDRIEFEESLKK